jgi:hypothetical protein
MDVPLAAATGAVVVVAIVIIIGAIVIWYLARQRQQSQQPAKLADRNLAESRRASAQGLRVGDVVNYENSDFVVQGTLRFNQDGFVWEEHLLVDGDTKRWLSVEDDEGIELVIWDKMVDPDLEPGANRILHGGTNYTLEERGHANYTADGTTGTARGGQAEYIDYEAGKLRLSFERYGDESGWELSVGKVIGEGEVDIYPAAETGKA